MRVHINLTCEGRKFHNAGGVYAHKAAIAKGNESCVQPHSDKVDTSSLSKTEKGSPTENGTNVDRKYCISK